MRILIIGGTNFIGPYVVQSLREKGHEVILFNRGKTTQFFPQEIISIKGERAKLLSFKDKLISLSPDIVIDMIPYSENDATQVANIFHGRVKRIVIISSCDVYHAYDRLWNVITGKLIKMPLDETADLRKNLYPYRKIMATLPNDWGHHYEKILVEKTIRSYTDINSTILRLPMVYGPRDYSRIYPYLKRMDENRPILLNENKFNWRFCRGYVEDIAHAIVLSALDSRIGNKIYNVGEKNAYSESEWIQKIGHIAGWKNKIITLLPHKLPKHLQEPDLDWEQDLTINTDCIRDELNYNEFYTDEDSMQKSIDWLRKNPPPQMENILFDYNAEDDVI